MVKYLYPVSVIIAITCMGCKVPETPELTAEDIIIITKGKYIYVKPREVSSGSIYPEDTFTIRIDTSYKNKDTMYFEGVTYSSQAIKVLNEAAILPLRISKSAHHLWIQTQLRYEERSASRFNNLMLHLPLIEPKGYEHNICKYYIKFNPNTSKYIYKGKEYNNGWDILAEFRFDENLDPKQHTRRIIFSPQYFIQKLTYEYFQSNVNTATKTYHLYEIIYD